MSLRRPIETCSIAGAGNENTFRRSAVPRGGFALSSRRSIYEGGK
jgi:hypothetical protein